MLKFEKVDDFYPGDPAGLLLMLVEFPEDEEAPVSPLRICRPEVWGRLDKKGEHIPVWAAPHDGSRHDLHSSSPLCIARRSLRSSTTWSVRRRPFASRMIAATNDLPSSAQLLKAARLPRSADRISKILRRIRSIRSGLRAILSSTITWYRSSRVITALSPLGKSTPFCRCARQKYSAVATVSRDILPCWTRRSTRSFGVSSLASSGSVGLTPVPSPARR
jgi:hypothetical protein